VDIGDGGGFRFHGRRSFLIPASRKAFESLLAQENGQRVNADAVAGDCQFSLDVINREVLLPHSDGQVSHTVTHRSVLGPTLDILKEAIPFFGIVPELVAKDAKATRGVSESPGDFMRRLTVQEKSPQRLILPMEGLFGH
jgi:hypothetical protein